MQPLNLTVLTPMLTLEAYAEQTNQTLKAVQHQVEHRVLPFVQPKGKRGARYINMTALMILTIEAVEHTATHNKVVWKS